jgi:hypothetical protein
MVDGTSRQLTRVSPCPRRAATRSVWCLTVVLDGCGALACLTLAVAHDNADVITAQGLERDEAEVAERTSGTLSPRGHPSCRNGRSSASTVAVLVLAADRHLRRSLPPPRRLGWTKALWTVLLIVLPLPGRAGRSGHPEQGDGGTTGDAGAGCAGAARPPGRSSSRCKRKRQSHRPDHRGHTHGPLRCRAAPRGGVRSPSLSRSAAGLRQAVSPRRAQMMTVESRRARSPEQR